MPLLYSIGGRLFFATVMLVAAVHAFAATVHAPLNAPVAAENCGSIDHLIIALRFTSALYPKLRRRHLSIALSAGHGNPPGTPTDAFSLGLAIEESRMQALGDATRESDSTSNSWPKSAPELPLYLDFSFVEFRGSSAPRRACHPITFMNNRMTKQMQQARKLINSHPEWTDAQDIEAVTKLGMRFGPDKKDALLRELPLKQLSSFYGPLRIRKVTFEVASEKQPNAYFAFLQWSIKAEEVGTRKALQIVVEPFDGRITSITE